MSYRFLSLIDHNVEMRIQDKIRNVSQELN